MINMNILLFTVFLLNIYRIEAMSPSHRMNKRSLSIECGYQLESSPITSDNSTLPLEHPWLGMLIYQNSTDHAERFACNAILISDRYVVTAAQCVTSKILTYMGDTKKIRLGSGHLDCMRNKDAKICTKGAEDFRVDEVIIPDAYQDTRNREDDIALLKLDRIVEFTDYIRPVCLPESTNYIEARKTFRVPSWGREHQGLSRNKAQAIVETATNTACKSVYSKADVYITDKQVCAEIEEGYNACNLISGAPLLEENNGQFTIVGILSFGAHCTAVGWPDVYTAVPQYRTWIDSKAKF